MSSICSSSACYTYIRTATGVTGTSLASSGIPSHFSRPQYDQRTNTSVTSQAIGSLSIWTKYPFSYSLAHYHLHVQMQRLGLSDPFGCFELTPRPARGNAQATSSDEKQLEKRILALSSASLIILACAERVIPDPGVHIASVPPPLKIIHPLTGIHVTGPSVEFRSHALETKTLRDNISWSRTREIEQICIDSIVGSKGNWSPSLCLWRLTADQPLS